MVVSDACSEASPGPSVQLVCALHQAVKHRASPNLLAALLPSCSIAVSLNHITCFSNVDNKTQVQKQDVMLTLVRYWKMSRFQKVTDKISSFKLSFLYICCLSDMHFTIRDKHASTYWYLVCAYIRTGACALRNSMTLHAKASISKHVSSWKSSYKQN